MGWLFLWFFDYDVYMAILILFALLFSGPALGHSGDFENVERAISGFGFVQGLLHPIQGMDHLLAMLCVGLISSKIGKRAIWQVPACFVVVMAIGCVFGFFGSASAFIEPMIAASVIVFGLLLVLPFQMKFWLTLLTVGLFAAVHGYAHGKEMPLFVLPEVYIIGFMTATTVVHVVGVGIGEVTNRLRFSATLYRITGIALVISGIYFIVA